MYRDGESSGIKSEPQSELKKIVSGLTSLNTRLRDLNSKVRSIGDRLSLSETSPITDNSNVEEPKDILPQLSGRLNYYEQSLNELDGIINKLESLV